MTVPFLLQKVLSSAVVILSDKLCHATPVATVWQYRHAGPPYAGHPTD